VEVVGFPGNQGRRFLLREAAYRRISAGTEPVAREIVGGAFGECGLGRRAGGSARDSVTMARKEGEVRLLIYSRTPPAKRAWIWRRPTNRKICPLWSWAACSPLTGVYEVQKR